MGSPSTVISVRLLRAKALAPMKVRLSGITISSRAAQPAKQLVPTEVTLDRSGRCFRLLRVKNAVLGSSVRFLDRVTEVTAVQLANWSPFASIEVTVSGMVMLVRV